MPNLRSLSRRRPLVALIVLILLLVIGYAVQALDGGGHPAAPSRPLSTAASGGPSRPAPSGSISGAVPRVPGGVSLSALPVQAATTVRLIQTGGPFPYRTDGIEFDNLERHLPLEPRGYYHEYTVVTPGSRDRGARRIVTGARGEFYYTGDHYQSFVSVDVRG